MQVWQLMNLFPTITSQGFTQAILMSGRRHKELNLLIEFWSSILMKCFFASTSKQTGFELVFNINQIAMLFSMLCYYLPSRHKKARGFTTLCSTKAPRWIHHNAYSASIQTPTFIVGWFCNHFSQNITFKNSIFFQKQTLVKYIYC